MKKNIGFIDKFIRTILAGLFIWLWFSHRVTGAFGVVLLIAAAIFFITSFTSVCPLYKIIGISSCPKKQV